MKQFEIKDFSRGLVTNVRNEQMQSNEFPILKNWDYETRRAVSRRLGFEDIKPVGIPAGKIQGLFEFSAKPYRSKSVSKMFDFENHANPLETDELQKVIMLAVNGQLVLMEDTNITSGSMYVRENGEDFVPSDYGWDEVIVNVFAEGTTVENNSEGEYVVDIFFGNAL